MTTRRQNIESELHVLQEAVASAVHELSQPLNVVNLLADNALEDVANLQAAGTADAVVLSGLRRRVESIVDQAGKASDITRWVRAFAVSIDDGAADFDPGGVIERVVGIFANDLRVAGIKLVVDCEPGTQSAVGNEALFGFALTEAILWLSHLSPRPARADSHDGSPVRRILVLCREDPSTSAVAVTISADTEPSDATRGAARSTVQREPDVSVALPLMARAGRAPGSSLTVSTTGSGIQLRLSLPLSGAALKAGLE